MWNVIEDFVDKFGQASSNVGKYWITMFNVLRYTDFFSVSTVQLYAEIRPPPTGAEIRPFLSGLYYHSGYFMLFYVHI